MTVMYTEDSHKKPTDQVLPMKFNRKLNRSQLSALILCLGTSLGLCVFIGGSSPFIGIMLGTIPAGVYFMIVSGRWVQKVNEKIR